MKRISATRYAGIALACALLLAASACHSVSRMLGGPSTREIALRAEALVAAGHDDEALALVDQATAGDSPESRFWLEFTRGWVRHVRATSGENAERAALLDQAGEHYAAALALRPDEPQTIRNLALLERDRGRFALALEYAQRAQATAADALASYAAQVLVGDMLSDPTNPAPDADGALATYLSAYHRMPEEAAAPERALELCVTRLGRSGASSAAADELSALCRELVIAGRWQLAATGLEALMAGAPTHAVHALENWVELQALHGSFQPSTLARLPALGENAELDAGLIELTHVLEAPQSAARADLPFWTANQRRCDVAVKLLRSLAGASVFHERFAEAAQTYERALELGAGASQSVQVDVALDLAILYHTQWKTLDQPERAKLKALVQAPPLLEFAPRSDLDTAERRERKSAEMEQIHTVLGLIWGELGAWKGRAEQHLDQALGLAAEASGPPRPAVSAAIASGEAEHVDPIDRWIESARGYMELDSPRRAEDQLRAAEAHLATSERKLRELEELVHPRRGLYFGLAGGATFGHVSSAEFENTLFEDGHITEVDLDSNRYGLEAFVGYRFKGPLALLAGYVSLEGPSSSITELTLPPNSQQLLADVADEHPLGGKGWTLAVEWTAVELRRFELYLRLGGWAWEADADVRLPSGGGQLNIDETGQDLFFGVGGAWKLNANWRCNAELERFFIDGDPVDLLALGVMYQL